MASLSLALGVLAAVASTAAGARPTAKAPTTTARFTDGRHETKVAASGLPGQRRFRLTTTAPQRAGSPATRTITETKGAPSLSTKNPVFDALHALAVTEAGEASVSTIQDAAFAGGKPQACPAGGCFETGELWTYVWTRDTAYAADLGLAALDPTRVRNSLEFKLSERRTGGGVQIVQDTGSGGSYPVSTDRVVWALGARRLLDHLVGPERQAFARRAFAALRNTVEHDRRVAFDPRAGLYRGETSFLDWREQTYPGSSAGDAVEIGASKALSTNVVHDVALKLLSELAHEHGYDALARRYGRWAGQLEASIRKGFAVPGTPLLSSFLPGELDDAPTHRFDLLGNALAITEGIVPARQARAIVARYPHLTHGAPVVWPQEKGVPIYHNRSLWPFVTAYWMKAAQKVGNAAAVSHAARSLVRGAALNLSNLENLEAVEGLPWVEDGALSGPVVNSRRQLWSIAGYLSMVNDVVFGLETDARGLRSRPYLTRELRHELFGATDQVVLDRYVYRGRPLKVVLNLPKVTGDRRGAYRAGPMRLNGRVVDGSLPAESIPPNSVLTVDLLDDEEPADASITEVDGTDPRRIFAPARPSIAALEPARTGTKLRFGLGGEDPSAVTLNVYRDGALVAKGLPGTTSAWTHRGGAARRPGHAYAVEAIDRASGNASHRSRPQLSAGPGGERLRRVPLEFRAAASGRHLIRFVYRNPAGPINTGITAAVKRVEVVDVATGAVEASSYVVLPHAAGEARSSFVRVPLETGRAYAVRVVEDAHAVNMSAFSHFQGYAGAGGVAGPRNDVTILGAELAPVAD